MRRQSKSVVGLLAGIGVLLAAALFTGAQTNIVASRITQAIDPVNLTVLRGNTHPYAQPQFDRGAAPASLPMQRMLLVLQRSAQQERALERLLEQQQDASSANYHQWLTPQQFGQQFGPSDQDIQTITSWLQSQGFQVNRVSNGRTVIEFSGTAGEVQSAFHTSIHQYQVNGENHWANSSDPEIPTALTPVVAGVKTLHNFYKKPQVLLTGQTFKTSNGFPPEFSTPTGLHALAPGDYATIYNINPLYNAVINGTGEKIAVVGRSDFIPQDVTDFRNEFQLPSNPPQIVVNGPNPGIVSTAEQFEATLDVSWASAVAPDAQIIFVVSASTNTTDGVDLSEQYIVDYDLADVMTESFGGCEAATTSADAASISSLAQQAAAEGITYMVSTGDSGAEGCDNPNTETAATGPLSPNVLASSPYTIGVGGTQFNEGTTPAKYWSSSNSASLSSALSYIPEDVWNQSCVTGCAANGGGSIFAGGGGASIYFSKPSWQSAVAGIPQDGARDLPDVSLTAAGHDPYLLCFQYSCEQGRLYGVGGTSASAPSFAGIMALVDQKTASRQGQANYVLYRLAAQEAFSKCNASSQSTSPTSTCIFNDTTIGNNAVPGETGYGTSSAKYQSTAGYDQATGLGSVNVANLVNDWGNARSVQSATSLTINPSTGVIHGTPLDVSVGVTPASGGGTPTGDVGLVADFGSSPSGETSIVQLTLSNGTASSSSINQLPGGTYNVQAHYEGDGTFVPSDSSAVQVNILPEPTTETAAALTGAPPNLTPFTSQPYGSLVFLQAKVAGQSGVGTPTGTITFTDSVQGNLSSTTLDNTGTATTSNLAQLLNAGSHSVTASYSGDPSFKTTTSSAAAFTLTPDATVSAIALPLAPLVVGTPAASLQVNVTANSYGVAPTGTVTAFVGGNQLGSPNAMLPVTSGGPTVYSFGNIPLSAQSPGQITVTATYSGDSNYQSSTTTPLTVNLVRPSATTLASSAASIQIGQSVTFTAAVAPGYGSSGPAPTGTVQFAENGTSLASVPVSQGQAQFTTSSLPAGILAISVTYSGDTNYAPSYGGVTETVNLFATTTTVTTSNSAIQQGSSITLTANVAPSQSGGPSLTGDVQFWSAISLQGSENPIGAPVALTSGQAQITTSALAPGIQLVGASYSGDANYSSSFGSTAETVSLAPTFTISANPATIPVTAPGQSGSATLTFSGQNGFSSNGSVALMPTCTGLPSASNCSISPSSINIPANGTATATLSILTTAPSASFPGTRNYWDNSGWQLMTEAKALASVLILLFCVGVAVGPRGRRRRWGLAFAAVALVLVFANAGCGGGSSLGVGGGGGGNSNPGTPVGTYTITVSFTINGVTQAIPLTVNVQ
jgi:hypothetical protein